MKDDEDVEERDELIEDEPSKMEENLLERNETTLEHFDRKKEKRNCWKNDCKSFDSSSVSFVDSSSSLN